MPFAMALLGVIGLLVLTVSGDSIGDDPDLFTLALTLQSSNVVDIGQDAFNQMFWDSPEHILKRECSTCGSTHRVIYYKRYTDLTSFNLYKYTYDWESTNNVLGNDFNLFSTLEDALADTNPWTYCNYDDHNIGMFRDCGTTGYVAYEWTSRTRGGDAASFYIYTGFDHQETFINSLNDIPSGWRQLTAPEAMIHRNTIVDSITTWSIIKLAGGRITGSGYGGQVSVGIFDGGLGWTWLVPSVSDSRIKKMFIGSFDDIPAGWRMLTTAEAEDRRDEIVGSIGAWAIYKIAGGKIDGSGYGGKVMYGIFDGMLGWTLLVPSYAGAQESSLFAEKEPYEFTHPPAGYWTFVAWYHAHYYQLFSFLASTLVILCGLSLYVVRRRQSRRNLYAAVKNIESETEMEAESKPIKN